MLVSCPDWQALGCTSDGEKRQHQHTHITMNALIRQGRQQVLIRGRSSDLIPHRLRTCHAIRRSRLHRGSSAGTLVKVNAASTTTQTVNEAPVKVELPYAQHKWLWKGKHVINYATAGCGDPIILVHGFGLSSSHYRKTIVELAKSYKVYAIDLLGFGRSSKPIMEYKMEIWAELVSDFMAEFTLGRPATLVGNSIGGLTCLMAAVDAPPEVVRGVVLLNTAGAMNNKGLLGDWRIVALYPLLMLIDFLLSIPTVAASIFNSVRTKENIKAALTQVYSNKDAVTDELVELVYAPSCDSNAREVFISVITGPPGPSPMKLIPRITAPMLVLWGDQDTLTPADGPVGKYLIDLPNQRPNTRFKMLPDVGHCLHDDKPELVHAELLPWLQQLHASNTAECREAASTRTNANAVSPDTPVGEQPEGAEIEAAAKKLSQEPAQTIVSAVETAVGAPAPTIAAAAEAVSKPHDEEKQEGSSASNKDTN